MGHLPQRRIERAEGITPAERYLKRLCDRTFLSLWSYSGVFRDQGKTGAGDGKEVCDLLVVFNEHVLIFSDKSCEFPSTDNPERDWCRWFRRAVLASADQVWGAERWLKTYSNRLFLDRKCTQPFPLNLPDPKSAIFHRIVVAHNASRRCQEVLGGSGSLMLIPRIIGPMHHDSNAEGFMPFAIGQLDPRKGYVHVLDDTTLDILLGKLDTISDFVSYLTKKERFVTSGALAAAAGEEELLANYLVALNDQGEHDFVIPKDVDALAFDVGFWKGFENSPERQSQIKADKISYKWDSLIEHFGGHIKNNTSYFNSHESFSDRVVPLRFMAAENRTRRRLLAASLYEFLATTRPPTKPGYSFRANRVMQPTKPGEPYYVFLLLSVPCGMPDSVYREGRLELLNQLCLSTKLMFPDALDIVGIAMEPGLQGPKTEDALYVDLRNWTPELQAEAEEYREKLSLLKHVARHAAQVMEYPVEPRQSKGREPHSLRNSPCRCGSGRKFKKCCGRPDR